jgi:hypothetical protein
MKFKILLLAEIGISAHLVTFSYSDLLNSAYPIEKNLTSPYSEIDKTNPRRYITTLNTIEKMQPSTLVTTQDDSIFKAMTELKPAFSPNECLLFSFNLKRDKEPDCQLVMFNLVSDDA